MAEYSGRKNIKFTTKGMVLAKKLTESDTNTGVAANLPFENSSDKHVLVKSLVEADRETVGFNVNGSNRTLTVNEMVEGYKLTASPSYSYSGGGDSVTVSVTNNNTYQVQWYNGTPAMDVQTDSYTLPDSAGTAINASASNASVVGTKTSVSNGISYFKSMADHEGVYSPLSYASGWSVSATVNSLNVSKTGYGSTYKYKVTNRSSYAAVQYSVNNGDWENMAADEITVDNHNIRFRCYSTSKLWSSASSYSYSTISTPTAVIYIGTASDHGSTSGMNTHGWFYVTTTPHATIKYGTSSSSLGSSATADSSGHAWIGPYTTTTTLYFQGQVNSNTLGYANNSSTSSAYTVTKLNTPAPSRSGYGDSVTLGFTPTSGATGYYGTSSTSPNTSGSSISVSNTTSYYFQQRKAGYISSGVSSAIAALQCSCSAAVYAGDNSTINTTNYSSSTRGRNAVAVWSSVTGGTISYGTASGTYNKDANSFGDNAFVIAGYETNPTTIYYKITADTAGYLNKVGTVSIQKASTPTLTKSGGGASVTITPSGGAGSGTYYRMSSNTRAISSGTSDTSESYTSATTSYWISAPTGMICSDVASATISACLATPSVTKGQSEVDLIKMMAEADGYWVGYRGTSPTGPVLESDEDYISTPTSSVGTYYFCAYTTGASATLYGANASIYVPEASCTATVVIGSSDTVNSTNYSSSNTGIYGAVYFSNITGGGTIKYSTNEGDYTYDLKDNYTEIFPNDKKIYWRITSEDGYLPKTGSIQIPQVDAPSITKSGGGDSVTITPSSGTSGCTYYNSDGVSVTSENITSADIYSYTAKKAGFIDSETVFVDVSRAPTPTLTKEQDGDNVKVKVTASNCTVYKRGTSATGTRTSLGTSPQYQTGISATGTYYYCAYRAGYLWSSNASIAIEQAGCTATVVIGSSDTVNSTNYNRSGSGTKGAVYFSDINGGTVKYSTTSGSYTTSPSADGYTTPCTVTTTYYWKVIGSGGYISHAEATTVNRCSTPVVSKSGGGSSVTLTPSSASPSGCLYYNSSGQNVTSEAKTSRGTYSYTARKAGFINSASGSATVEDLGEFAAYTELSINGSSVNLVIGYKAPKAARLYIRSDRWNNVSAQTDTNIHTYGTYSSYSALTNAWGSFNKDIIKYVSIVPEDSANLYSAVRSRGFVYPSFPNDNTWLNYLNYDYTRETYVSVSGGSKSWYVVGSNTNITDASAAQNNVSAAQTIFPPDWITSFKKENENPLFKQEIGTKESLFSNNNVISGYFGGISLSAYGASTFSYGISSSVKNVGVYKNSSYALLIPPAPMSRIVPISSKAPTITTPGGPTVHVTRVAYDYYDPPNAFLNSGNKPTSSWPLISKTSATLGYLHTNANHSSSTCVGTISFNQDGLNTASKDFTSTNGGIQNDTTYYPLVYATPGALTGVLTSIASGTAISRLGTSFSGGSYSVVSGSFYNANGYIQESTSSSSKTSITTCLSGNSFITTISGRKKITDIKITDKLLTYDFARGIYTYQYPLFINKGDNDSLFTRIYLEDGTHIDICGDHHDIYDPVIHKFRKYGKSGIHRVNKKESYFVLKKDIAVRIKKFRTIHREVTQYGIAAAGTLTTIANDVLVGFGFMNYIDMGDNKWNDGFIDRLPTAYSYDTYKEKYKVDIPKYLFLGMRRDITNLITTDYSALCHHEKAFEPFRKITCPENLAISFMEGTNEKNLLACHENDIIKVPETSDSGYNAWYNVGNSKIYKPGEDITVDYSTVLEAIRV